MLALFTLMENICKLLVRGRGITLSLQYITNHKDIYHNILDAPQGFTVAFTSVSCHDTIHWLFIHDLFFGLQQLMHRKFCKVAKKLEKCSIGIFFFLLLKPFFNQDQGRFRSILCPNPNPLQKWPDPDLMVLSSFN